MQWIPTLVTASVVLLVVKMFSKLFSNKWDPNGKHCYVTGGSSGLGLALAILLTKKGAHVSIVSRDEERLKNAMLQIEAARLSPNQRLHSYAYSLSSAASSREALEAVCAPHDGRNPDAIFMCAGSCHPRFWIEENEETMRAQMDQTYWVQAWTALEATKRIVAHKSQNCRIVFHSAYIGYITLIGYAAYAPGRMAIRALADSLRAELQLYNIHVHIAFPGTMYTPGYEIENKTKPKITLKIEEADPGVTGEVYAKGLLRGVQSGSFHITPPTDLLGNIFRASMRGTTPSHGLGLLDSVYALIGWIGLPVWRQSVDRTIRGHRKEHEAYCEERGFYVK